MSSSFEVDASRGRTRAQLEERTYVVVGSTLASGEDGRVDSSLEVGLLVLSEEDQTSSRSSEGLVAGEIEMRGDVEVRSQIPLEDGFLRSRQRKGYSRGGGDDITVLEGRVLDTSGDETRDVSHVGEEVSSLLVGDGSKLLVVPVSRVGGSTTDDHSRLEEVGVGGEGSVVDKTGLSNDLVREGLEVDGRGGHLLLGGL